MSTFGEKYGLGLIGAAGSIASNVISNKGAKKREAAARKYNLEQWHRQNAYNHPIEQMARLKAAGLNPNLIYGSSPGSAVGNAGAVAPGKAPDYSISNPMMPFMDTRVKQAQSNNLEADILVKGTQSMKNAAEAGIKGRELDLLNERFDDLVGMTKTEAAIKNIDYKLKEGVLPYKISSAMSQAEKDSLAVRLLQEDLKVTEKGYIKGNYMGTILGNAFGINLNTQEGRKKAQIVVSAIVGSSIFKNLTQGLQGSLKLFNNKTKKR